MDLAMNSKKLVLLLVIGVVVALFVSFGGHEILTLENLQKHQSAIEQWIDLTHPALCRAPADRVDGSPEPV